MIIILHSLEQGGRGKKLQVATYTMHSAVAVASTNTKQKLPPIQES